MKLAAIPRLGWRRFIIFIAGALVLVVVGRTYTPALEGSFIWDDHALVERVEDHRGDSILRAFTKPLWTDAAALGEAPVPYYRPVVALSYRFDRALGGAINLEHQAHSTNLLLHLLACVFLALLAIRLGAPPSAGVLASLAWGLLPRLAESIAWISGRTDVLACVFGLACLLVSPDVPSSSPQQSRRGSLFRRASAGLLLFLALASKEVAIAFAGALIVAVLTNGSATRSERARGGIVSVALPFSLYIGLRVSALGGLRVGGGRSLGFGPRLLTIFEAWGRYAEMTLDAFRPRASIGYVGELDFRRVIVGVALAVFAVAYLVVRRRRMERIDRRLGVSGATMLFHPALAIAITLLGLSILAVTHVVPINLSGAVAADRLLYIPLAAIAIVLAILARKLERPRSAYVAAGVTIAFVVAESFVTEARAADFASEARFWVTTAEDAHPHNTAPLNALAAVLRDDGEVGRGCRFFEVSNRLLTTTTQGASASSLAARRRTKENLAGCLALVGRYDESLAMMQERAKEQPTSARVMMDLGFARLHVLDVDGAEEALQRASQLDKAVAHPVAIALERFPFIRADLAAFQEDDRALRGDILRYARFLARLGRRLEAEGAFMNIALDPRAPERVRGEALEFLANYSPYDLVSRASAACQDVNLDGVVRARLAIRRANHEVVHPLLPRVDALLHLHGG